MTKPSKQIGPAIREARLSRNLTLQKLAKRARIDFSQLAKIERGECGTSLDGYAAIARALGVELADLLGSCRAAHS